MAPDPTLPVIIVALSIVVTVINSVGLIVFGRSLLKNRRRHAGRWSYLLLATTFVQLLFNVMLSGIGTNLISGIIQFFILLALSITIDPSLRRAHAPAPSARPHRSRSGQEGMLGRDLEGKGYIQLNFFNLFWVFMVCCVLGLIIEVIYHMVVVDPGVYQDRAGLLFGPFSPIYGCGAVLLTIALNRFYKANPIIIFIVSAIIGGVFEAFVSWFMQTAFGAVAWDYTGMTLFGIPDPHRHCISGAHQHPVHVHVGRAWLRMDQALLAVAPEAHQHDSMEAALLTHHRVRGAHARQRRHDASGARLLVRTRLGHLCQHTRGRVLRRALR